MSTELVPTYRGTLAAGNGNIGVQPTSFTPLQQGGFRYAWTATNVNTGFDRDDMSTGGYGAPIGILPTHDILALTSHSSDASISYKTVIWNGYGAGRYHTHYRNEETNYPLALSRYPTMVLADGSGMKDAGSSTNSQSTPTPTGGNYVGWDTAHCPSVGYMAYLLTGKWYFMEECQFALIANHYNITDAARAGGLWNGNGFTPAVSGYTGASGICTTGVQLRSSAWHLRSLVQAFAITPSTHPLFTDLKAVVEANCDWFYAVYGTGLSNPFGLVYDPLDYGSIPGSQAGSAWMQDFVTAAWGYALCLRLPISNTSSTKMSTFFEWKAKNIVNKLGDSSGFWYVNGAPYEFANAPTAQPNYFSVMGATGPWYASWKAMYDATYPTIQSWMSTTEGVLASGYFPENPPPSMFHNLQPAIAYAVRHNATGALASYNRMINASNWSLLNAGFSENPVWGLLPAIIPSVAASSLSLSGPSTGMASVPSTNFTVTVDNPPTGTVLVTPSDGGAGGTFTSSTVSITPTVLSATFTYTASSSGVKTITITNNASLSNPTSLTFTASAYSLPSWMSGKAVGEWFAISGTSGAGGAGIDPWGGIAINPATSEIYIAASGGHNDGADNRVVSLSLASSTPSWTLRKASTWNGSEVNVLYYADGTPGARHIYYHIHYMASRNAILLAGCRFGYGGGTPTGPGMDLFDLSTNQWLPRYTLPDISPYTGYGVAQDTSGNIWTTSGVKFNATTNTWSQPGSGSLGRFPSALDSSRNKIFSLQFADGQGYNPEFGVVSNRLDPTTGNSVSITFNSSAAFTQFTNAQPSYAGMDYDSSNDKFMFYHQGEPSTVYVITPNNTTVWDMSLLSTSGVTPTIAASGAGVNKRFIYVPALNGFVLLAKMSSDLYFIRTS